MPADFHFIRPEWLLAIPVAVVIAVLLARRQLGAGHWRNVIDPALIPPVLSRRRGRGVDWRWLLTGIGGVIAAVAPLLGLLGTVTGMISTFDIITEFGTGDPKLLSSGISIALVTTEVGLAVAIPALIFGNLLSGWAESIKDEMEKAALHVMNQYKDKVSPELEGV